MHPIRRTHQKPVDPFSEFSLITMRFWRGQNHKMKIFRAKIDQKPIKSPQKSRRCQLKSFQKQKTNKSGLTKTKTRNLWKWGRRDFLHKTVEKQPPSGYHNLRNRINTVVLIFPNGGLKLIIHNGNDYALLRVLIFPNGGLKPSTSSFRSLSYWCECLSSPMGDWNQAAVVPFGFLATVLIFPNGGLKQ